MVIEVEGKDESKLLCTKISFISKSQIKLNTQQLIVQHMSKEQEHFLCLCLCLCLYHVLLVEVMQPPGVQDQQEDWDTVDALELVLEQMQEPVEAQVVKRLLGGPDQLEDWGTALVLVLVLVQMQEPVGVQGQAQRMPVFLGTN